MAVNPLYLLSLRVVNGVATGTIVDLDFDPFLNNGFGFGSDFNSEPV